MPLHLTDAVIRRLPLPKKGSKITYDEGEPKGFGVRASAGGHKSFVLNYVVRTSGRERRYTIASCANWTCTDARAEAKRLRHIVDQGGDPLADIEDARAAPTVAELCDRFEREHLPRKRASTARDYKRMLTNHILPHFGEQTKVTDVEFADIDALHRKITDKGGSPYAANRTVAVLSKMFSFAIRLRMRESNPAKGIEKNLEQHRRRYLSADELARLVAALSEHTETQAANIIRLLLLTGARSGEVMAMPWADVDLTAGVWSKPPSSTKQKQHHEVQLSAPARQLLSEIREQQAGKRHVLGTYVFPGPGASGHCVEIKKSWASICKAAGITELRIHDLRHSFASQAISGGASLPLVGALLGHASPTTTARYAHMFVDPQKAAVERIGAIVTNAGKPATEPTPIKRR